MSPDAARAGDSVDVNSSTVNKKQEGVRIFDLHVAEMRPAQAQTDRPRADCVCLAALRQRGRNNESMSEQNHTANLLCDCGLLYLIATAIHWARRPCAEWCRAGEELT